MAEADFEAMHTRAEAMKKYQLLLSTYGNTGFVKRSRPEISARIESGGELLLPALLMRGHGIFKPRSLEMEIKRTKIKMLTWNSPDEPDSHSLDHNVEFKFYATANTEYKGWVLLGGCCKATFTWHLQGTDLTHYDRTSRKEIACDPSGSFAAPWKHRVRASSSHGGRDHAKAPKEPTKWEWAELPMPKYTTSGLKTFRLVGLSKGMAVAAAVVSSTRTRPPDEKEIAELAKITVLKGPRGTAKPEEWLVLGPFNTGNIENKLPPDDVIRMTYDTSVKGGPKEWKLVKGKSNRAWKDDAEVGAREQFGRDAMTLPELKSPAQIDKLPKGKDFTAENAYKPPVGNQLVSVDDKRTAAGPDKKSMFKPVTKTKE